MKDKIGIIFLHGAGLNSSIWDGLVSSTDHPVLSIDFPNRQSKVNANTNLSFDNYIDTVSSEIKNWGLGAFVFVAHSIGACVGLKVAELFKNELKGFVAIGSVIPKNGQSFVSTLPFPQSFLLPILMSLFGTKPPDNSIVADLCNDLNPDLTSKVVHEFTSEAKSLYTTKIHFDIPKTDRMYILLENDKSIPIDLQRKMAQNLNASKIETIRSGHLPMLSNSLELKVILDEFIEGLY